MGTYCAPLAAEDVPRFPSHGVYISWLILFAMMTYMYSDLSLDFEPHYISSHARLKSELIYATKIL